jgi:flagellar hook-length control protein FliK
VRSTRTTDKSLRKKDASEAPQEGSTGSADDAGVDGQAPQTETAPPFSSQPLPTANAPTPARCTVSDEIAGAAPSGAASGAFTPSDVGEGAPAENDVALADEGTNDQGLASATCGASAFDLSDAAASTQNGATPAVPATPAIPVQPPLTSENDDGVRGIGAPAASLVPKAGKEGDGGNTVESQGSPKQAAQPAPTATPTTPASQANKAERSDAKDKASPGPDNAREHRTPLSLVGDGNGAASANPPSTPDQAKPVGVHDTVQHGVDGRRTVSETKAEIEPPAPTFAHTGQASAASASTAAPVPTGFTVLSGLPITTTRDGSSPSENAVPIAGLAVEIVARAHEGKNRFEIRLDPPELGRIDVRLDVDRDGRVTSRLTVERAETLDLLKRDAPTLERALQHAGLNTDGGLEFSLRDQAFGREQAPPRDGAQVTRLFVRDDDPALADAALRGYARWHGLGNGIDIRV